MIVLLPDLMFVILEALIDGLGDLSVVAEPNPDDSNLDGVALERRFMLLLAFTGVFRDFGVIGCLN